MFEVGARAVVCALQQCGVWKSCMTAAQVQLPATERLRNLLRTSDHTVEKRHLH